MKKLFVALIMIACVASTLMIAGCTSAPPQIVSLPPTEVPTTVPTILVPVVTTAPVVYVTPVVTYMDTSDPNVTSTALGTTPVVNTTPAVNETPVVNITPMVNVTPLSNATNVAPTGIYGNATSTNGLENMTVELKTP